MSYWRWCGRGQGKDQFYSERWKLYKTSDSCQDSSGQRFVQKLDKIKGTNKISCWEFFFCVCVILTGKFKWRKFVSRWAFGHTAAS